ncbi:group II intron reverse transcriptase/maturase [bacterium AH-315-N03]|nr:group II intron reverse transcriptase/maturase [bacterium AH-315-N03]
MVQKSRQLELPFEPRGGAPKAERSGQASTATSGNERSGTSTPLVEALQRENLVRALKRVRKNRGSPGIDGMTVDELPEWLREHWPGVREQLLAGTYQPAPVRRVVIPKPGGGERQLGIPTVLDRLIQQILLQVLQPQFDPTFSEHSHGFRPKRGAHDAIREARQYVEDGKRWVVDVDVEKFFDRVNHDVLMGRLERRIEDRRVLGLIRRYLNAGILANGVVVERYEGVPQGGPLSPLLANVLLDEVDKELERRGHAFVRYADDLRVYVGSKRAGERVMSSLVRLLERLRLRVNESKSAVALAQERPFLGFEIRICKGEPRIRIAGKSVKALKGRIRTLTRRVRGRSLQQVVLDLRSYLLGWRNYFDIGATHTLLYNLDKWIRHRLRAYQLKQWKNHRTIWKALRSLGISEANARECAGYVGRWWRGSMLPWVNRALPNHFFDGLGLPRLAK